MKWIDQAYEMLAPATRAQLRLDISCASPPPPHSARGPGLPPLHSGVVGRRKPFFVVGSVLMAAAFVALFSEL